MPTKNREYQHPLIIRWTHWTNFIALGIMVASGLRIYNASTIWDFRFPEFMTLGGWLAGARMWHFFGMWIFFINGMVWFFYNLLSKHGWRTTIFNKADLPGILPMIQYYLRIRKVHPPVKKYNALQKMAYTTISFVGIGSVLTGIAIYWPTQFSKITWLFGGYDTARIWHFAFMFALVTFFLGHLAMVAIAGWWNFVAIITGWKRIVDTPALDSQQSKEPRLPSDDKTDSPRNVDMG